MKLSESKIIKMLNTLSSLAVFGFVVFIMIILLNILTSGIGKGKQEYQMRNVVFKPSKIDPSDKLTNRLFTNRLFNNNVILSETKKATVFLRYKNYSQLYSFPPIAYLLSQFFYWLLIGVLILLIKIFFKSLSKDEIFINKNSSIIMFGSIILMWLPIIRWVTQELFINCINQLSANDSNYIFENGERLFSSETTIGLVLLAFGLAFRVGVDIKKENDGFV